MLNRQIEPVLLISRMRDTVGGCCVAYFRIETEAPQTRPDKGDSLRGHVFSRDLGPELVTAGRV